MFCTSLILFLATALPSPALAGPPASRDIVDTAVAAESFKTLTAVLKAADLVDALKANGPFTVFAPTDRAFAKLPPGTIEKLLKPENRARLQAILAYHVVPGRLELADLLANRAPKTLGGSSLAVSLRDGRIGVQRAFLVTTDIQCTNGIIHVIDTVMIPDEDTILDVAQRAGSFETLLAAVDAAGLRATLMGEGPFTVFAPTDEAFAKLPEGTIQELLKPANRAKLGALLAEHVVRGRFPAANALRAGSVETLAGSSLEVAHRDGVLSVGSATLLHADLHARNGIIHVIDRVILPRDKKSDGRAAARQTLQIAIERGVPIYNAGGARACASLYEVAVRAILGMAGESLLPQERSVLERVVAALPTTTDDKTRAWELRRAMDTVLISMDTTPGQPAGKVESGPKDTTFTPLIEAPLPAGFPAPGPVGEVVFKEYPKYRAARAEGRLSFWTLFSHIKRNKIEMTAPVEISVTENDAELEEQGMAFLYATPELGSAGKDGSVDVVDLDPVRVLSYGIRGPKTDKKLRAAMEAINARLSQESANWKRDGEWRLLGYNSPMIPADRRFWELQVPVAPVRGTRNP